MRIHSRLSRCCTGLLLLGATLGVTACDSIDDLLRAENPAAIGEPDLDDPTLVNVLVNSVVGSLAAWYDDPFIWRGSMITDEQISGINWEQTARLNQRLVRFDEGDASGMFNAASRYRFMADSISGRLQTLLPNPSQNRNMALVLAHAGYSYTLMGEVMCESVLDVGAEILTPAQLGQRAITRFEQAISVAQAANAPDVANLARVGLARAALLAGDNPKVLSAAAAVPSNFVWWVEYDVGVMSNSMQSRVTGANHALGVHPRFVQGSWLQQNQQAALTDPRIQHFPNWRTGHNALSPLYTPYQGIRYSEYNAATIATGGAPVLYGQSTNIQLASGVEAMHHYYEAAGPNGTGPMGSTLDFVNARRAVGRQAPVELSGEALMSELRDQRARDTFMGGFRLGDLRRYAARGINDPNHTFPGGTHPTPGWGAYGDATCYPLPLSEYVGNPNIGR
jgi:hypothetical protein